MRKLGRRTTTLILSLLVSLATFAAVVSVASLTLPSPPTTGSTEWPMFHATADHRGWTDAIGPTSNQLAWTFDVNAVNASDFVHYFAASPVIHGGRVFAAAEGSTMLLDRQVRVVALGLYDGAPLWTHDYSSEPGFGLTGPYGYVRGGSVFLGLKGNTTIFASETGGEGGRLEGCNRFGPTLGETALYIGGTCGFGNPASLRAYRLSDFTLKWSVDLDGWIAGGPSFSSGIVVAGTEVGTVYGISENGNILWSAFLGAGTVYTPAISSGVVIISRSDGLVRALDLQTGQARWSYATSGPISSSPAASDSVVYVGSADGKLYALALSNGTLLWSFSAGGPISSSPAVSPSGVLFGSADRYVYDLRPDDGAIVWSYETGDGVSGSAAIVQGMALIGSEDGRIYAFGVPPSRPSAGGLQSLVLVSGALAVAAGVGAAVLVSMRGRRATRNPRD